MSNLLSQILQNKNALSVLHLYGLDQIISEQDDPQLWASILAQHWYAPSEPECAPSTLRFGIGEMVSNPEGVILSTKSGMLNIEVWCFQRIDNDHLHPVICPTAPGLSMMAFMTSGSADKFSELSAGIYDYLDVSRPSAGYEEALIHNGFSVPPNAGSGETLYWTKTDNGIWQATHRNFSSWLS